MSEHLDAILAELGKLQRAELEALQARIKALLPLVGESSTAPDVDLVLEVVCSTLKGISAEFCSPEQLRKSSTFAAFKDKVPGVMEFVRMACSTRNQQRAMLGLGIKLLYKSMTDMGLPTSARYVIGHIHRVPSMINQAFPGYASGGLLGALVGERLGTDEGGWTGGLDYDGVEISGKEEK